MRVVTRAHDARRRHPAPARQERLARAGRQRASAGPSCSTRPSGALARRRRRRGRRARSPASPRCPDENPEGELEAVLGDAGRSQGRGRQDPRRARASKRRTRADAVAEAEAFGARGRRRDALEGREDLTGISRCRPSIPRTRATTTTRCGSSARATAATRRGSRSPTSRTTCGPARRSTQAALARGSSIYLPDRAIPMLPRALSSNLCSLLPGRDAPLPLRRGRARRRRRPSRRAASSRASCARPRSSPTAASRARSASPTEPEREPEAEAMREDLRVLYELSRLLRARRMKRGALDFDLPEAEGRPRPGDGRARSTSRSAPQDPGVEEGLPAHRGADAPRQRDGRPLLVERDVPADLPRPRAARRGEARPLRHACATTLGIAFDLEDARDPKKLSALLKSSPTTRRTQVLNMLLLRAMKQAVVRHRQHRPLRPRLAGVPALHLAHPALPGPRRPPRRARACCAASASTRARARARRCERARRTASRARARGDGGRARGRRPLPRAPACARTSASVLRGHGDRPRRLGRVRPRSTSPSSTCWCGSEALGRGPLRARRRRPARGRRPLGRPRSRSATGWSSSSRTWPSCGAPSTASASADRRAGDESARAKVAEARTAANRARRGQRRRADPRRAATSRSGAPHAAHAAQPQKASSKTGKTKPDAGGRRQGQGKEPNHTEQEQDAPRSSFLRSTSFFM